MNPYANKDAAMYHACLEKAPLVAQGFCLQSPGHPGTHQAYVKDSLIEWELQMIELPTPVELPAPVELPTPAPGYLSSTAA